MMAEIGEPVLVLSLRLKSASDSENVVTLELNKSSAERLLGACVSANKVSYIDLLTYI